MFLSIVSFLERFYEITVAPSLQIGLPHTNPVFVVRLYFAFFVRKKIIAMAIVTTPITKAPIAPCIA